MEVLSSTCAANSSRASFLPLIRCAAQHQNGTASSALSLSDLIVFSWAASISRLWYPTAQPLVGRLQACFKRLEICVIQIYAQAFSSADGVASCSSAVAQKFIDSLQSNSITQHVNFPTYKHSESYESTLDLVLSDEADRVSELSASAPLGHSERHHYSMQWRLGLKQRNMPSFLRSSFNYARGDYDEMNSQLAAIDWASLLAAKDPDDCFATFLSTYNNFCEQHIPTKRRQC